MSISDSHTDLNNPALKKPTESPFVAFLDSFLQEKNIKWVLTAGMMILLGSSLMMVTRGWDQLDAAWQHIVIIGYTATIFGAGSWSYHKLGLRKTGTGLLALSVLLIPLSFVAWYWIWFSSNSGVDFGLAIGLLVANTIMAGYASRKIFAHFLQGEQLTFLLCYLALSVAGAVAPCFRSDSIVWMSIASVALWGIFTAGVIKANRHVFWLTEEHRQPRIFGFFPIILLGAQFLLVVGFNFASAIPYDWFGFACVLVAIPVLLTANTVAEVFQQRTGNLVRPLPWAIMLPIVSGIILCAVGVSLALSGLAQGVPYAVVPTAALTAVIMGATANRTNRPAFVWAMLGCITLAYNFSPVFFQEIVFRLRDAGASALSEDALPYAFYGLTYLPLIAAGVVTATRLRLRGNTLFETPLRQFCVGISVFLLAVATTHEKALFPVASLMTAMFAWQATVFGRRIIALFAMIAFLVASLGLVPFASGVLNWKLGSEMFYVFTTAAAAALLLASRPLNVWISGLTSQSRNDTVGWVSWPDEHIDWSGQETRPTTCSPRTVSLVASVAIASVWLTQIGVAHEGPSLATGACIFAMLAVHSLVWTRAAVSWVVYGLFAVELLRIGNIADLSPSTMASWAIVVFGVQWFVGYLLDRIPNRRVSRAWSAVNHQSAFVGLLFGTLIYALPNMAIELFGDAPSSTIPLRWVRDILLVAWCFDAARRPQRIAAAVTSEFLWERRAQPISAFLGSICVLGLVGCGLVRIGGEDAKQWLPLAWTITAASVTPLMQYLRQQLVCLAAQEERWPDYFAIRAIARPIDILMMTILVTASTVPLLVYSLPICSAGYVGLAALLALAFLRESPPLRAVTAAAINWTIILAIARFGSHNADNLVELMQRYQPEMLWWVAALSAISLAIWQLNFASSGAARDIRLIQRITLRLTCGGALLLALGERSIEPLEVFATVLTVFILFASELCAALRTRDVARVWLAEGIVGVACLYLLWFGVIQLDNNVGIFAPLGLGIAAFVAGTLFSRRESTEILAQPLIATGRWLPLAAVGIGIFRYIADGTGGDLQGLNSLAILTAGGFYFWQAIEQKSKGFAVLAAAILNVAIMLLWGELNLTDAQFYMIPIGITILVLVEVLKREIPAIWHNPLRYAGALTILVSPTFHIVDQTWWHLGSLMVLSTAVLLVSIGLRIRALMYTGIAFLIADLIAMVICGGIDNPNLLWIAGIGFGAAIITLGAICENNREKLLQRMRIVSAQMEQWQ